jgi:hypothetical protein
MKNITESETVELLEKLQKRFVKNMHRHDGMTWEDVKQRLVENPEKMWSLGEMERTGGEPDVIGIDIGTIIFCDCCPESPIGRRSLCYDMAAWESRKEHKPESSAVKMAEELGIELLSEDDYRKLQELGEFDLKTSSWIKTPTEIRKRGGALFMDRRYNHVFLYHNGAESYYASRGFRGKLLV